ncbi:putative RNA-binding domain-containing protein [Seiridium cardinale]
MDSRSPSRERYARSVTPRSRYSRSPSPARRRRSPSRSVTPPSRRNGRYRSGSRSRSRSWSRDRESRGRSESPLRGSTKIVVEKLTKNINEDHLREIFGQYGSIRDLDLPMNRQFNTNRGTAYILYVHEADAEAAIAHMHEAQLDGAVINVSIVLPRRKFSQSPPTASRGANIDPRVPAPGPRGGFAGGPRGPRGGGFGGPSFGGGPGDLRHPAEDALLRMTRDQDPPHPEDEEAGGGTALTIAIPGDVVPATTIIAVAREAEAATFVDYRSNGQATLHWKGRLRIN